jgi:hypothetical protein
MCKCIRESDETIYYDILDVVRGRKTAYQLERKFIGELTPSLNDF